MFPFFSGDVWLAKRNFEWLAKLDGTIPRDCVLACDDATNPAELMPLAQSIFPKVELVQYPRAKHNGQLMLQWPWQQNNAFANTARYMAQQKEPWLWFETDCTAMCPGWWKVLEDEYIKGGKPFGGHWNEAQKVFNGVAIYPHNAATQASQAMMAAINVHPGNRQNPWDVACSQQVYPHKMHVMNHVMQHLWRLPFQKGDFEAPTFPTIESVKEWLRPGVVLFHRCKDGSLMDRLKDNPDPRDFRGQDVTIPDPTPVVNSRPKVDLFCVSYKKDLDWFHCLLKSYVKYAHDFHQFVVLVPMQDEAAFKEVAKDKAVVKTFVEQPGKGMIHHEAMVCCAENFCTGDYIAHVDSDCIFWREVAPEEYFQDGKPILLMARFDSLPKPYQNWKTAVELALGFTPEYETMQRHPAVHPRWLYSKVRAAVEAHTGRPFLDYVLSCRNEFPQTFAEFPIMGAWALKNSPGTHHTIDVSGWPEKPVNSLIQFWSHGGIHRPIDVQTWGYVPKQWHNKTPFHIIREILH